MADKLINALTKDDMKVLFDENAKELRRGMRTELAKEVRNLRKDKSVSKEDVAKVKTQAKIQIEKEYEKYLADSRKAVIEQIKRSSKSDRKELSQEIVKALHSESRKELADLAKMAKKASKTPQQKKMLREDVKQASEEIDTSLNYSKKKTKPKRSGGGRAALVHPTPPPMSAHGTQEEQDYLKERKEYLTAKYGESEAPDASGLADTLKPKWIPKGKEGKGLLNAKKGERKISGKSKNMSGSVASATAAATQSTSLGSSKNVTKSLSSITSAINSMKTAVLKILNQLVANTKPAKGVMGKKVAAAGASNIAAAAAAALSPTGKKKKKKKKPQQTLGESALESIEENVDRPTGLMMQIVKHQYNKRKQKKNEKATAGTTQPQSPAGPAEASTAGFKDVSAKSDLITSGPEGNNAQGDDSGGPFSGLIKGAGGLMSAGADLLGNMFGKKKSPEEIKKQNQSNKAKAQPRDAKGRFIKKTAATKGAAEAGTKATAKAGAKVAGKGLAKAALKKIPIIGGLAGLAFAGSRLMSGDYKGAALEAAGGLAGTIPGIGTAASLGADAALMAHDMSQSEELEKQEKNIGDAKNAKEAGGVTNAPNTTNNISSPAQGGSSGKGLGTRNNESSFRRYIDSRTTFA